MERPTDFTYTFNGTLYRVHPETQDAIDTYNNSHNHLLQGGMWPFEFDAFKRQARAAGYVVRRMESAKATKKELDDIIASLDL